MGQPGRRAVALWIVFGAVAVISCALVLRRPDRLSDLHIYYGAVEHLRSGQPLYGYVAENGGPFTYPPFAALALGPIALVPEGLLQPLWMVATIAALAAIAAAVGRGRPDVVAAVACGLLLSAPAQSNLRFGQVSVFVVLLALVDALGLTPARYRGCLVGLAAAVKLTPLLFVVYFLAAGRRRDAARAFGAFVGAAAVAALVLPGESWTYWTGTMLETARIGDLASLGNQSVQGMLLRLGLPPAALPLVWAALVGAVCLAALLRARRLFHDGHSTKAAVLVGCATVAASPVSWTHHQLWPVLAAMLLIGTRGAVHRAAGGALLAAMVLSLGVVLAGVSLTPGVQFVLENARALGTVGICVLGFGAAAAAAARRTARRWTLAGAAAVAIAVVAVQPLPASADPTFKAYRLADTANPRYFYVCRDDTSCAAFIGDLSIRFGVVAEKTKVRVNGVVGPAVARLEYRSAPGGRPREIPLLPLWDAGRVFSFRSASLAHGRLVAYDSAGNEIASYRRELTPAAALAGEPRGGR
ncbi:glycosyltransferase 87 family protein [Asanoa sp. WMMD1127]|uniref:glycosyltransferase 87 family protein n=1 Tax=Asanoa sp. WMMD1127 TaxID=3016107 RepID=UPI00241683CA|nr:glycosyltransferase 87 family protein [Asanoa sp. WMMD1127]MDG4825721.1 glycosyltransferase 87 family protein [Asanoa sp. WMMD1127]